MSHCDVCGATFCTIRITDDGEGVCHDCWHGHDSTHCQEPCGWTDLPTEAELAEAARDYDDEKADHQIRLRKEEGLS